MLRPRVLDGESEQGAYYTVDLKPLPIISLEFVMIVKSEPSPVDVINSLSCIAWVRERTVMIMCLSSWENEPDAKETVAPL